MIPTYNLNDRSGNLIPWDTIQVQKVINKTSLRTSERLIEKSKLLPATIKLEDVIDEKNNPLKKEVISNQVLISKKRRDGILLKFPKPNQDLRTDLPTIGIKTLKKCASLGLKGVVIKAKYNIFLDRKKSLKIANKNKMFILAK